MRGVISHVACTVPGHRYCNLKIIMPQIIAIIERIRGLLWIAIIVLAGEITISLYRMALPLPTQQVNLVTRTVSVKNWSPPDWSLIPSDSTGDLIKYGRELIVHTAYYLGPRGTVRQTSNGMNCQNCHLEGGTKPFAANYSAVASTYPKFRARSGTIEGFEKRVNDCIERSLNGTPLPHDSREMQAIVAYLKWVGKDVTPGQKPKGAGLRELPGLDRPADPRRGRVHYAKHCSVCHGEKGQGIKAANKIEWMYPPLWGPDSYNTGAGLYRISRFAGFIKANMPFGVTYENPFLSDEQAWDIAAFVNSMPRPHRDFPNDWPDIAKKPVDHPFGPYVDDLPESVHKFGPFPKKRSPKK